MKYLNALIEVKTFLKDSSIRSYYQTVCKGKCCGACTSHQCFKVRNLACATYLSCPTMRKIIPNIGGEVFIDIGTVNFIHQEVKRSMAKVLGLENTWEVNRAVYKGLTVEQYLLFNTIKYPKNFLAPIRELNPAEIKEKLCTH